MLSTRKTTLFSIAAICCLALPMTSFAATLRSTVQGTAQNGSTFVGNLSVTNFTANKAGGVSAVGTLTGSLVNQAGNVIGTINQTVDIPLSSLAVDPSCQVLTLNLGPLDLNLLGLQVHLNQVVLTITANPAGGLLGSLLCSLAGQGTTTLVTLLNQILAILAGL